MKNLNILILSKQRGSLLVELLIAIGLGSLLLPTLIGSIMVAREGKSQQKQRTQAVMLVREAEEAVRSIRENGWGGISTNGTYHPEVVSGQWILSGNAESINGFSRQIVISSVERNDTGDIVTSGGTIDPSTKKIEISVTWGSPLPSSADSVLYITRHDNMPYTENTQPQFDAGTKTEVVTTSDDTITLGTGGGGDTGTGDWCKPSENTLSPYDIPGQGVATAISAQAGQVFLGTGSNASGISYGRIGITNTNPPVSSLPSESIITGYKSNDIFAAGDYTYIATDTNSRQGVIISTSENKPTAYLKAGTGNTKADSVFATETRAYLVAGNNLYVFDVTNKGSTASPITLNPLYPPTALAGTGTKGKIVNGYAYVTISGSATKLQILNISSQTSAPTVVASANFSAGNSVGIDVSEDGNRAYIVTSRTTEYHELFIINTENKSGTLPNPVGSYNSGDMDPRGVIAVIGYRSIAIMVGIGGIQYQVINLIDENLPKPCGNGLTLPYNIYSIDSVIEADGDAYSYILTDSASGEFQIINGGPGDGYSPYGEYESATYTLGRIIAFNRIFLDYETPNQTDLTVQVASTTPSSLNCNDAVFRYVGPDGTPETSYDADGAIPVLNDGLGYSNPGLCFRYKILMTTDDSSVTPVFNGITVNHSP